MTDLIFGRARPSGPPWALVFGEEDGGNPAGRVTLTGMAILPGAQVSGGSRYVNNVARPTVNRTAGRWQVAATRHAGIAPRYQHSQPCEIGRDPRWQDARPLPSALVLAFNETLHAIRPWAVLRQQDGTGLPNAPLTLAQQQADPAARLSVLLRQQDGNRVSAGPLTQHHQDGWRDRRYWASVRHQQGRALETWKSASAGMAVTLALGILARYQAAMRARAGVYARPAASPAPQPCYTPSGLLVFAGPRASDGLLIFMCERAGGGALPHRTIAIPVLRVYMTTHHMQAVLLPGGESVTLLDVQLSADADNPGWSLSATGPDYLMDQLGGAGAPKQIRLTIDGLPWVFAVERLDRTRAAGQRRVRISAVSTPMLLGQPYLPAQTWLNAQDVTAQQLVADALQYTGVDVDWQIPDWLVTAGAWSFTGTPLAAAVRIAESVGAVLQSDPVNPLLRYLPRYPTMPWEWPHTPADVTMPSAAILTDSLERGDQPEWEAVYVMGTTQGVMTRVKRTGTAAALLAPMVTDDLITHVDAASQRGRAILGAGGRQANITLSMPLLSGATIGQSGPGLLHVGQLLEVVEPAETWRGLVRGVSLAASFSSGQVRQSLRVERHY